MQNKENAFLQVKEKAEKLGCIVYENVPLSKFTTIKVGGKCPLVVQPCSEQSLSEIFNFTNSLGLRLLIMGKGSNLICDDKGFDGVVILVKEKFSDIKLLDETTVEVEAGCSLVSLCRFCYSHSLKGLEFAFGIPGTVGGAVNMNAGAYGGEMKDVVELVRSVDCNGNINEWNNQEIEFAYRSSIFHHNGEIITGCVLKLEKGDKDEIKAEIDDHIERRRRSQPLNFPSAGSTFKRPVGQFAGKLVDDCGLKGYRVGGAMVSEKHAGFVINYDNATAQDLKDVIQYVQKTVLDKTGYFLECEVKIIPFDYDFTQDIK